MEPPAIFAHILEQKSVFALAYGFPARTLILGTDLWEELYAASNRKTPEGDDGPWFAFGLEIWPDHRDKQLFQLA